MGFLDFILGPQCMDCGIRLKPDQKREWEGKLVCEACRDVHQADQERKQREADERAHAQAEARARLDGGKTFGSDPRYD